MVMAYMDCASGAAGDMIVGAMLDAGLDFEYLQSELSRLSISGYSISVEKTMRRGIGCSHFKVDVHEDQPHRHYSDIVKILDESDLSASVRETAHKIFRCLAEAEASVHNTTLDHIHFHEVGAIDAIVDIVGASIGFEALGITDLYVSPVNVGSGTVTCAHGTLPVPAPATAYMAVGVPIYSAGTPVELTTPTGMAILKTMAVSFGDRPMMEIAATGYGAGSGDFEQPNVVRLSVTDADSAEAKDVQYHTERLNCYEANIDDMNPEFFGYVMDKLLNEGALDVYISPIYMKKGRPASKISVLSYQDRQVADRILSIMLSELTTLGVRQSTVVRHKLEREIEELRTDYGMIRVKYALSGDEILNIAPEYEDCKRAAAAHDIPVKQVYDHAKFCAEQLMAD